MLFAWRGVNLTGRMTGRDAARFGRLDLSFDQAD
jgi:hypothetical protein